MSKRFAKLRGFREIVSILRRKFSPALRRCRVKCWDLRKLHVERIVCYDIVHCSLRNGEDFGK